MPAPRMAGLILSKIKGDMNNACKTEYYTRKDLQNVG